MRILILTAGYGEGHNSAARGIQSALTRLEHGNDVELHDLFAETYGHVNDWIRKGYLTLINNWPRSWGHVYKWLDRKTDFYADFRRFTGLKKMSSFQSSPPIRISWSLSRRAIAPAVSRSLLIPSRLMPSGIARRRITSFCLTSRVQSY
jgi:hypothetical protein